MRCSSTDSGAETISPQPQVAPDKLLRGRVDEVCLAVDPSISIPYASDTFDRVT